LENAILYGSTDVLLKIDMNLETSLIPANITHLKLMKIEQLIEDYWANKKIISKLISISFVKEKVSCNTCNSYLIRKIQSGTFSKKERAVVCNL